MKKLFASAAVILGVASFTGQAQAAAVADVVVVVDESGSMGGEHAWLPGMISSLDTALAGKGITGNFALVGFGASSPAPHLLTDFTTAAGFGTAAGSLVTSGGFEDGYDGIDYAFSTVSWTAGSARNVILVTDEDRDVNDATVTLTSVAGLFSSTGALWNTVNDALFSSDSTAAGGILGIDSDGNAYKADGVGGFTVETGGTASSGFGTTIADYVTPALATGGAAWDLNLLRAGGVTSDSFTAAFVDIKVEEIQQQLPEAGSLGLLGLGLIGLGLAARRRKAA